MMSDFNPIGFNQKSIDSDKDKEQAYEGNYRLSSLHPARGVFLVRLRVSSMELGQEGPGSAGSMMADMEPRQCGMR
jgi:hypothetical protein